MVNPGTGGLILIAVDTAKLLLIMSGKEVDA